MSAPIVDLAERAALIREHLARLAEMQRELERMSVEIHERLNFSLVYQEALSGLGKSAYHLKLDLRAIGEVGQ